jgi:TPR repeat protein
MRSIYVRIAFLVCFFWANTAAAENRVALVIGNAKYVYAGELANPTNDAADMAAALKKLGFAVIDGYDLPKAALENKIREFSSQLSGADVGLFFYAGHGLQVSGVNYIVPVDAQLTTADALDFEMVRLDIIQRTMERSAKTNLLFLDACRNNPLARNLARAMGTRGGEIGRGLAPAESGIGTLISFSTQPGNVARDGSGRNSPFTGPLVSRLATPGEDVLSILTAVRKDVLAATNNGQVPWENHALLAKFYFNRGPDVPVASSIAPLDPQAEELEFWRSVATSRNPKELKVYLDRYPSGIYAGLARERISSLEKEPRSKGGQQGFLRLTPESVLPDRDSPEPVANNTPLEPDSPCDWLTASPFDRDRLTPGVTYAEMSRELKQLDRENSDKTLGCQAALSKRGRDPRLQFQSARALLAQTVGADNARSTAELVVSPSTEMMDALREAAEDGSTAAMVELGRMAFQGIGSEKNQIQAVDWWQRAAARGDGLAMALLGVAYAGGHGVPQDRGLALSWARHALDYKVARQLILLEPLREFMNSGEKPFRKVGARFAELISEQAISHFGSEKGGPELVLSLAYPLLISDASLADYWLRRAAGAGNTVAVLRIGVTEASKHPDEAISKHLAMLQTAAGAGEPLSKGLLGIALAVGEGVPRDEHRARELIEQFLASGFVGEALMAVVDVVAEDMRYAGFAPAEIESHRKVLVAAFEGMVPQPGDADVILALLAARSAVLSPPIQDRLTALAKAGNTNAMLLLAYSYFEGRNRIAVSIRDDLDKEDAKSRGESRQRVAEWISRAAKEGSRVALAIDAMLQARGFAGSIERDLAEDRARQLGSKGLLDITATLLEYTTGRFPAILGPGNDEIELTWAERGAARGVVRRLFDGLRKRNDLMPSLLALSNLVDFDDRGSTQAEADALDALRTLGRKDGGAIANIFIAAYQLANAHDLTGVTEDALKSANYMRLAADQGEPLAQLALGVMYALGVGVARDEYFAKQWVAKALGTGQLGDELRKLAPIASKLISKDADGGNIRTVQRVLGTLTTDEGQAEALIALVLIIQQPGATGAQDWLVRAAAAGNTPAKSLLADPGFTAALAQIGKRE